MSAPQWAGSPVIAGAASGTSLTIGKPTAVVNGDVLVAVVRAQGTVATAVTVPSGWARAGSVNGASDRAQGIFYKLVTDATTEPATYVFGGWSSGRSVAAMRSLRGVDPANTIGGSPAYSTTDPASYTVAAAPFLAVALWGDERTDTRSHVPSSTPAPYSALDNVQSTQDASTTGSRTALWWGSLAIADGGPTTVAAAALTWPVGTSANRSVAAAFRGITTPAAAPRGFSSVAHMLATPGATWAHRGGSTNWPEMSEYAYDQAVLAGYGALEFSAHRTSDGVWIGSHDPDLNRTSELAAGTLPNISAMTWAQVQTYMNTRNSAGTPRAYYRLDAFLDKYTPTHVCIVDPKNDVGRIAEFLAICDAHGGNTKIVVKFFGVGGGSTALADAAATKQYQTWGYFYEADYLDGDMARDQSHWSILGMNYDASQAAWDAALSYGKPVVGHIAGSQTNYDTAIAKGARMVQSANVAGIRAVGATNGVVQSLPALTSSASGAAVVPAFAGAVTAMLAGLSQSASGGSTAPAYSGAVAAALPPLASAATGTSEAPTVIGAIDAELPALVAASVASSAPPAQAGSVTTTLPALTTSAAGSSAVPERVGALDTLLPALTAESIGVVSAPGGVIGAITSILGALDAAAVGTSDGDAPRPFPDRRTLTPTAIRHTLTASAHSRTLEEV